MRTTQDMPNVPHSVTTQYTRNGFFRSVYCVGDRTCIATASLITIGASSGRAYRNFARHPRKEAGGIPLPRLVHPSSCGGRHDISGGSGRARGVTRGEKARRIISAARPAGCAVGGCVVLSALLMLIFQQSHMWRKRAKAARTTICETVETIVRDAAAPRDAKHASETRSHAGSSRKKKRPLRDAFKDTGMAYRTVRGPILDVGSQA